MLLCNSVQGWSFCGCAAQVVVDFKVVFSFSLTPVFVTKTSFPRDHSEPDTRHFFSAFQRIKRRWKLKMVLKELTVFLRHSRRHYFRLPEWLRNDSLHVFFNPTLHVTWHKWAWSQPIEASDAEVWPVFANRHETEKKKKLGLWELWCDLVLCTFLCWYFLY